MLRVAWSLLVMCLLPTAGAAAQGLRVELLTIGPGELPYERFGHNALLFTDPATGRSVAFDWGRFDFEQPGFIGRFVRGDMRYSSGADDGELIIQFYSGQGRRVTVQTLNVSPEQARALYRACLEGVQPGNSEYTYDYFLANCSTCLRDALDAPLGGQIKQQLAGVETGTSFRREAERHMAPDWPLWFGFHAGFGAPAERPIDAWEQAFLPEKLAEWLRTVEVTSAEGSRVPLVGEERVVSPGRLPPAPAGPPGRWWQTGLIGLALAAGMVGLAALRRQWPARLAAAAWFLVAGLGGVVLVGIWALSGHWAGYANQSILLFSPLALPLAVTLLVRRWDRASTWLAAGHLGLCLVGVALWLIPGVGQENAAAVALALPLNIAAAWVAGVRPGWPRLRSGTTAGREAEYGQQHAAA